MKDTDKQIPLYYCTSMQQKMEDDGCDYWLIFSNEATFHVNGKVNPHNTRAWGIENPRKLLEHQQNSRR